MPQQVLSLIGTGVVLGIVHVLSGPDHLSALATLSANVGNVRQAALLGIRWGIGHSTGLLLVAIILIVFDRRSDNDDNDQDTIEVPRRLAIFFETVVGIFLIFLGSYGIHRAIVKRSDTYLVIPSVATTSTQQQHQHQHYPDTFLSIYQGNSTTTPIGSVEVERSVADIEMLRHGTEVAQQPQASQSPCRTIVAFVTNLSARSMAILAGIIHGLAGPGGVLGVIPAIQLHNGRLAALYLFCFCVTSTITMGVFAAIYGSCSSSLTFGQEDRPYLTDCTSPSPRIREFRIEFASACLSIFVGLMWLVLLAVGKLDEIFP